MGPAAGEISLVFPAGRIKHCTMIAAVAQKTSWGLEKLAFNWFDVALVLVILFGLWRGRKHGMSKELLPASQWVAIVAAGGFGYAGLGNWLLHADLVKSVFGKNFTDRTWVFASSYLIIAAVVFTVFVALRRHYGPKLSGSSAFGGGEYYLGMISGALRTTCMLIAALALLNAPVYTAADIQQRKAYANRWYGGGMKDFSGDFIPSVDELQVSVFKQSLLGPVIKDNLGILLINTGAAGAGKKVRQN
jgi:uncharacterized membrane protein required for colicin V production